MPTYKTCNGCKANIIRGIGRPACELGVAQEVSRRFMGIDVEWRPLAACSKPKTNAALGHAFKLKT